MISSQLCQQATLSRNPFTFFSVALCSRLVDVEKLYQRMLPLVAQINADKKGITLSMGQKVKSVVQSCLKPGVELPSNLVSLQIKGGRPVAAFNDSGVYDAQFIVIHSLMDVGLVDLKRRARCCMCSCNLASTLDSSDENRKRWATAKAFGCSANSKVQFVADCTLGCV